MKSSDPKKRLNPLLETLGLIFMTQNFEAVKADLLNSLEQLNIDSRSFYRQHLSYLEDYVREFEVLYQPSAEDSFFFGYHTEFFLTVAAIATELFTSETDARHLETPRVLSVMSRFFSEEENSLNTDKEKIFDTWEDWFSALSVSGFSEDTRWRLLELIHDPVEKFRQLFEICEKNRAAFDCAYQKNKTVLEKLISAAPANPSAPVQSLADAFHPGEKKEYLTVILPLIEWITPAIIFRGVLADKIDLYRSNLENAKEMLPPILKLLGDKSKFEILCLLKSHGKYNLEIAEELQLTPATASHHMSMLLSNRMVTVEKKAGKVYYQLNQDTLKDILNRLAEVFL